MELPGLPAGRTARPSALARALTGDNGRHVVSYQTEAGHFQDRGLSTVICGPGSIAQAHQPDEFITDDQLDAGTRLRAPPDPTASPPEGGHPMPVVNRFADLAPTIAEWRRDIHAHPEVLFDTHRTSALVADKLRAFGCDEVVDRHRPHRRRRRDPRARRRLRAGGRPPRRHGRAADDRGDRPALRLDRPRRHARLRPRRPHRDAARRRAVPRRDPATSTAPPSSSSSPPRRAAAAAARWSRTG